MSPSGVYDCYAVSSCPRSDPCRYSTAGICGGQGVACPVGKRCTGITGGNYACIDDATCPTDIEYIPPNYGSWNVVYSDIGELLSNVFNILLLVGLAFGVLFVVKAGYTLKTSEGHPDKTRQGKEELTAAVMGMLFIGLSLVILRIIIGVLLGGDPGF
jgi:hypothetical protein